MPKYFYKCLDEQCLETFEVVHSMKEKLTICPSCDGTIERVPLNLINIKKQPDDSSQSKTGSLVKKSIEEFRQDLKDEKKRLKKVEYT